MNLSSFVSDWPDSKKRQYFYLFVVYDLQKHLLKYVVVRRQCIMPVVCLSTNLSLAQKFNQGPVSVCLLNFSLTVSNYEYSNHVDGKLATEKLDIREYCTADPIEFWNFKFIQNIYRLFLP